MALAIGIPLVIREPRMYGLVLAPALVIMVSRYVLARRDRGGDPRRTRMREASLAFAMVMLVGLPMLGYVIAALEA
ncbi:MAG: hypothetical protein JWO76_3216 [Nocardioides sp.]|nr:hypothetical protein [Nocardioides sp.]